MSLNISATVLVCPRNDEESLQILKLAEKINLATVVSNQPHGAKLNKEKNLLARVMEANPNTKNIVIVEIPGLKEEEEIQDQGIGVVIVDHHRYDNLDRMKSKSSLEQFCDHFDLTNEKIADLGFDPKMIAGVGAIDRGFLWELKNEDLNEGERKAAIAYYKKLTIELGGERRERADELAGQVWKNREEREGIIILRSQDGEVSVRNALSFIVAENYPEKPPQIIILQGDERVYVQESEHAKELHDIYGGFTFGRDACWGKVSDEGKLPSLEEIITKIA